MNDEEVYCPRCEMVGPYPHDCEPHDDGDFVADEDEDFGDYECVGPCCQPTRPEADDE